MDNYDESSYTFYNFHRTALWMSQIISKLKKHLLYLNIFSKNRLKVSQAPHIRYLYVYFLLSAWTKTSKTGSRSDSTKITLDSEPIDSLLPAKTWFRSYVEARSAESKETTTWKTRTNNEGTNRLRYSCLTKRMRTLSFKLYFCT